MSDDLAREQAVRTLVARIAHAIDTRRWADLRALYADEVTTDYTSLFGGDVQRQSGDALIAGWRNLLGALDATQHLVGGDEWMVAGQWVIRVNEQNGQWRVRAMTLRTFYETGNRGVLEARAP
jgi:SnoaL-like domain